MSRVFSGLQEHECMLIILLVPNQIILQYFDKMLFRQEKFDSQSEFCWSFNSIFGDTEFFNGYFFKAELYEFFFLYI